jgi:hypothetical protein
MEDRQHTTDDGRKVMAKAHIAFGKVSLKKYGKYKMYLPSHQRVTCDKSMVFSGYSGFLHQ